MKADDAGLPTASAPTRENLFFCLSDFLFLGSSNCRSALMLRWCHTGGGGYEWVVMEMCLLMCPGGSVCVSWNTNIRVHGQKTTNMASRRRTMWKRRSRLVDTDSSSRRSLCWSPCDITSCLVGLKPWRRVCVAPLWLADTLVDILWSSSVIGWDVSDAAEKMNAEIKIIFTKSFCSVSFFSLDWW